MHLYPRNYLGWTGPELIDFYVQGQLGKNGQYLIPKKITRHDVLQFFEIKNEQEHFSEIFAFSLFQKYKSFFNLNWEIDTFGRTLHGKIRPTKYSSTNSGSSHLMHYQKTRNISKERQINQIFFFFRHSLSCFEIDLNRILECFNSANIEERIILVKKRLVVLKYRDEQEFSKKRQKQRKIQDIAQRLKNSHCVRFLSGKANNFFEKGLYDNYRKDFEEELFDAQVQLDKLQSTTKLHKRNSSQTPGLSMLEESRLDIFDSNMEASIFQNTLKEFKRNWTGKNIRKHERWKELKNMVTKTVNEAYQSFFNKPNMFLFLKSSSYILFPEIHKQSVFYLECYSKYR